MNDLVQQLHCEWTPSVPRIVGGKEHEVVTLTDGKPTEFSMSLGGPKWLRAAYVKDEIGFRWVFETGGHMNPGWWPFIFARNLSHIGRFSGSPSLDCNGRSFEMATHEAIYSVGRHSILLARYLRSRGYSPAVEIAALVHDTTEGLGVGDMNTHLKKIVGTAAKSYEDDLFDYLLDAVGVRSRLTDDDLAAVHAADKVFGVAEARLLNMQNGVPWKISEDAEVFIWLRSIDAPTALFDTSAAATINEYLADWTDAFRRLSP